MTRSPSRPTREQLDRYAAEFNQSATLRYFGASISFPDSDRVRVVLESIKPEQRGGLGSQAVNGGVLAALFDLAVGSTPALLDPTRKSATVQLSMSYEKAVHGNRIHVDAKIDSAGGTLLFASAEIRDEAGQVCAHCQAVVRLSKRPWDSGQSPAVN